MNDKQFVEAARHFAERIIAEAGSTDNDRLQWAFRTLTSRQPDEQEVAVMQQVLDHHRAEFAANPQAASDFIDSATTRINPNHLDRDKSQDVELASWTMLANLLFNLDETVTKG